MSLPVIAFACSGLLRRTCMHEPAESDAVKQVPCYPMQAVFATYRPNSAVGGPSISRLLFLNLGRRSARQVFQDIFSRALRKSLPRG